MSNRKEIYRRIMPLFLKDYDEIRLSFLRQPTDHGYDFQFRSRSPSESMEPYVEEVEFNLGSGGIPSVAVATYEDYTILSFSRGYYETDLEYHFFKFLTEQGLEVEIQSNLWEQN